MLFIHPSHSNLTDKMLTSNAFSTAPINIAIQWHVGQDQMFAYQNLEFNPIKFERSMGPEAGMACYDLSQQAESSIQKL